ncbi:MAG: molybdopterin-dependent oxidoreductase [Myxococcaceae bacterium]|nr:molybdopterin-dependent oxidoreductase [Myxococcaceae bacterium]
MKRREPTRWIKRRWTRRDLMATAPLAAAASVGGALLWGPGQAQAEVKTKGICRFCLLHCGIVATSRGKQLLRIDGDRTARSRGFLCLHGQALREMVHSRERLVAPLVRRGDTFHEVSWADALGVVAEKLQDVKQRFGARAFAVQTGWPLVRHPLVQWLHRLCQAFGTPNLATVSSLCEASLRMGQALTVGSKYSPHLRRTGTCVLWGADPVRSAPALAPWLATKAEQGQLIVIDPVKSPFAAYRPEHVSIRPGTDGALALGLIHQVIESGQYNRAFVAENTVGFEALAKSAADYSPERVEAVTSVPRQQQQRLVKRFVTEGPLGIWQGLGVEHHENGVQTVRAISSLEALCGRFDAPEADEALLSRPSPHFADEPLPALYRLSTPLPLPPRVEEAPLGAERYPLFQMYNREAQGTLLADAVLDDTPYPVRALMLVASNWFVTGPGTQRLSQVADKLELLVVVDPFLTPSAQRADVVLPAATFAEAPTVDSAGQEVTPALVAPQHEAWPDWKIVFELGRALGLGQYFPWGSLAEAMQAPRVPFMEDAALQPKPALASRPRFGTPTGKVEFSSALLEASGAAAVPTWSPPTETPSTEFPLYLVTGPRTQAYINSQFHRIPTVEAKAREPEVLLHGAAATKASVANGELVDVVSPHGRVRMRLRVTDEVQAETAVMPAGWAEANPNLLIHPDRRDPVSGFPAFRSGVCRIEKVRPV